MYMYIYIYKQASQLTLFQTIQQMCKWQNIAMAMICLNILKETTSSKVENDRTRVPQKDSHWTQAGGVG